MIHSTVGLGEEHVMSEWTSGSDLEGLENWTELAFENHIISILVCTDPNGLAVTSDIVWMPDRVDAKATAHIAFGRARDAPSSRKHAYAMIGRGCKG